MLIGADFEKVPFNLFGLDLVEPNALIGDTILCCIALYFASKARKLPFDTPFFRNWVLFLTIFGFGVFAGGIGHSFFNYFDVYGKYLGWISSIVAVYFLENAMIGLHNNRSRARFLVKISKWKLILTVVAECMVFAFVDLDTDPQRGLLIPSIGMTIGLVYCTGILGFRYASGIDRSFRFFWISLLCMIPPAVFQGIKLNPHPLFDRNDLSHLFLAVTLILYWKGINSYSNYLKEKA